jgi:hypothetical protein
MQPDSLFTMDGLTVLQIDTVSPRDHRATRAHVGWRRLVLWLLTVSSTVAFIAAFVLFRFGLLPELVPWLGWIGVLGLITALIQRISFIGYPLTLQKNIRKGRHRQDFVTTNDYSSSLVLDEKGMLLFRPQRAAEFLRTAMVQNADVILRKPNRYPQRIQKRVNLKRSIVRLAVEHLGPSEHLRRCDEAIEHDEVRLAREAHLKHQNALANKKARMTEEAWLNKMRKSGARGRVLSRRS